MTTTYHFPIGGSTIGRTLVCPGWVQLTRNMPRTSNAAADRGTLLHSAMDRIIKRGLKPENTIGMTYQGQVITEAEYKIAIVPALKAYKEFSRGLERHEIKSEVQVRFNDDVGGTADIIGQKGMLARLGDFKFGWIEVSVASNAQLMFYAAAALACGKLKPFKKARLAIIQPTRKKILDEHVETDKSIAAFARDVLHISRIALHAKKPALKPTKKGCLFCPADGKCPAQGVGSLTSVLQDKTLKNKLDTGFFAR